MVDGFKTSNYTGYFEIGLKFICCYQSKEQLVSWFSNDCDLWTSFNILAQWCPSFWNQGPHFHFPWTWD